MRPRDVLVAGWGKLSFHLKFVTTRPRDVLLVRWGQFFFPLKYVTTRQQDVLVVGEAKKNLFLLHMSLVVTFTLRPINFLVVG